MNERLGAGVEASGLSEAVEPGEGPGGLLVADEASLLRRLGREHRALGGEDVGALDADVPVVGGAVGDPAGVMIRPPGPPFANGIGMMAAWSQGLSCYYAASRRCMENRRPVNWMRRAGEGPFDLAQSKLSERGEYGVRPYEMSAPVRR